MNKGLKKSNVKKLKFYLEKNGTNIKSDNKKAANLCAVTQADKKFLQGRTG